MLITNVGSTCLYQKLIELSIALHKQRDTHSDEEISKEVAHLWDSRLKQHRTLEVIKIAFSIL